MSDLVVLGFGDLHGAAGARDAVGALEKEHALELIDAVVVERPTSGKTHVHQSHHPVLEGLAGGAAAGFMLGVLFLNPLIAAAIGAAGGGLLGAANDPGIDDGFVKRLAETIQPGTSALFLLVHTDAPDRFVERLRPLAPTVLHTALSAETQARLRAAREAEESP
jgi:uncharacterized membrane protein